MGIEIRRVGTSDWPRYVLADVCENSVRFWNGKAWVADFADACLYAFLPEACREFERLQTGRNPGEQFVQEFEAKVTVKLHADRRLSEQELARFLDRFAELFLPTDGPIDDSLVQAEIHWHELRQRAPDEFSNRPQDDPAE